VNPHPAVQQYAEHVSPALVKLLGAFGYGRVFVRAKGTTLVDHEGREYLDFLAGFGAVNLGHNHPRLRDALRDALDDDLPNLVHTGVQADAAGLAAELASRAAPLSICLFSSSGAEAVEAGLKLARAATRRPAIVYCKNGYHGLSLGTLSVAGTARMRAPFEPLIPECVEIPFGDLDALDDALSRRKAGAFLVEPIQAEGGVILPPPDYLRRAQERCHKRGALLVLDEVQTGFGRAGTMFAYQQEGFTPDILVLGKALGGSLVPISATLTTREINDRAYGTPDRFDLHGSTYAGNAFACRAALATLRILDDERLVEAAAARGQRLLTGLQNALAKHPFVRDIRGRGLLVALELGPKIDGGGLLARFAPGLVDLVSKRVFGQWLALRLLEVGILAQPATQQWNVLKLEPPLTVSDAEIDRAVAAIAQILGEYRDLLPLVRDVGKRLGKQLEGGWQFG
jgi:putrescine aminotransferase